MPASTACRAAFFLLLSGVLVSPVAAENSPPPGHYEMRGGGGSLEVTTGADGKLRFAILSIGANGHTCSLDGLIDGAVGTASDTVSPPADACTIAFKPNASSIEVVSKSEECRGFCGARAWFEGTYASPRQGCRSNQREVEHKAFTAFYRKKQYVEAYARLKRQFDECSDFFGWLEADEKRNDLALTAFHLGRPGECRELLGKTLAAGYANHDALRNALPPTDLDNYRPIAESTWFNQKLCGAAQPKGPRRG